MLNISLKIFKSQYLRKKNQNLYSSIKTDCIKEIENLINNFLIEKDSFVFEAVEKGFFFLEKTSSDQRKKFIRPTNSFAKEFDDYITTLKNLVL